MHAITVALLLTPAALATSTSVANMTRFSIALACADFMRRAQGVCGFGDSGYPTVSARPHTAMRSSTYGSQMSAVSTVTHTRYMSSGFIVSSLCTLQPRLDGDHGIEDGNAATG